MLGRVINNYEIKSLLGEGGMGSVYVAHHAVIDRSVAIKVMKSEFAKDKGLVTRFINEAKAAAAIHHPNIIDVIDVGILADGLPYLMMELLQGDPLRQRLRPHSPLPLGQVIDFASQIISALAAAHSKGIIHRDLKPENLFVVGATIPAQSERIKVLDFGIAKLRSDFGGDSVRTRTGAIIGTPLYMAPEQCRGLAGETDHRSDIYAVGVIVYEMLCGTTPFVAQGWGDLLIKHVSEPPPPLSLANAAIPASVEAAVMRALAKRREDRFQAIEEFGLALTGTMPRTLVLENPSAMLASGAERLPPTVVLPARSAPENPRGAVTTFSAASISPSTPGERRRRRWPWIVAGSLLASSGAGAILLGGSHAVSRAARPAETAAAVRAAPALPPDLSGPPPQVKTAMAPESVAPSSGALPAPSANPVSETPEAPPVPEHRAPPSHPSRRLRDRHPIERPAPASEAQPPAPSRPAPSSEDLLPLNLPASPTAAPTSTAPAASPPARKPKPNKW
jgi:serine/threonine protein kinase